MTANECKFLIGQYTPQKNLLLQLLCQLGPHCAGIVFGRFPTKTFRFILIWQKTCPSNTIPVSNWPIFKRICSPLKPLDQLDPNFTGIIAFGKSSKNFSFYYNWTKNMVAIFLIVTFNQYVKLPPFIFIHFCKNILSRSLTIKNED